jgi:hypothetical protein
LVFKVASVLAWAAEQHSDGGLQQSLLSWQQSVVRAVYKPLAQPTPANASSSSAADRIT